jgi:hypothetical protein
MSELTHLLVTVLSNQVAIMHALAALDEVPDYTQRNLTEHARLTERMIGTVQPKGKAPAA